MRSVGSRRGCGADLHGVGEELDRAASGPAQAITARLCLQRLDAW
jgi:hypothetical protein